MSRTQNGTTIKRDSALGLGTGLLQQSQIEIKAACLPAPEVVFQRAAGLSAQQRFSDTVEDILYTPIRGEVFSGNFARYLARLNSQQGFGATKLGLVLLVNDHAGDAANTSLLSENALAVQYVDCINKGTLGLAEIMQLDIDHEYKQIAREIIKKDTLEIRFDHLHSRLPRPHFGYLREHLLRLVLALKSENIADVKSYSSDVDTFFAPDHFSTIRKYGGKINFNHEDFLPTPEVHVGNPEIDISREVLTRFDEYRFWYQSHHLMKVIRGDYPSAAPTIAADISLFQIDGNFDPGLASTLKTLPHDEDWAIGAYLRKKSVVIEGAISTFSSHTTRLGEVYNDLRTQTSEAPQTPRTSAELLYNIITRKTYKGFGYEITNYNFLQQPEPHVTKFEKLLAKIHTVESDAAGHTEDYLSGGTFGFMLQNEQRKENAKVRERLQILEKYLNSVIDSSITFTTNEMLMISPYLTYFPEELAELRMSLRKGRTPKQIAAMFKRENAPLFNPNHILHKQIARLRALNEYAAVHNIDARESYHELRIDEKQYKEIVAALQP